MLSEGEIVLANLILIAAGAVLGAITWRNEAKLRRVYYLLGTTALTAALAFAQLAWIKAPQALASGHLGLVFGVSTASLVVFGYANWMLAAARSRDIKGTRSLAVLGFLPLANFYLMFATPRPSQMSDPTSQVDGSRATWDPALVVLAFAFFSLSKTMGSQLEAELRDPSIWTADHRTQAALARALGPEAYFHSIVEEVRPLLPTQIDDITEWTAATAEDEEITYWYKVDDVQIELDKAFGDTLAQQACSPDDLGPALWAGGHVTFHYDTVDGRVLLHRTVTQADCPAF
jgi:hypothetical protein